MDTSTIVTIAIAVITALVTIAVSWGIFRQEVAAMKEAAKEHREELMELREKMVTKEHCKESHIRSDKSFDEFKNDLKAINQKLDQLLMRGGV